MVDVVVRERLHEGHRLRTIGGGGGGRRIRPRRAGAEIFMIAVSSSYTPPLPRASVEALG